jgi:hypothetical protein
MPVVDEAGCEIANKRFERIRSGLPADAGLPLAGNIGADRLAVAPEVAGDGRDRPTPSCECVDLHVFSLCEHRPGPLPCFGVEHRQHRLGPCPVVDQTVTNGPIRLLRPGEIR